MNRSMRRRMGFATAVLAAGALGLVGASTASANSWDPVTNTCVPPQPTGLPKALHDIECLLDEASYRLDLDGINTP